MVRLMAFAVLAPLAFSCGARTLDKGVTAQSAYPSTFSAVRARILLPRCGPCHGLFASHNELVKELVVPGDVAGSSLYEEINTKGMPPYGAKLTDDEIAAVRVWIQKGAPND